MRNILFLAMFLPNFMGCNTADGTGYNQELKACNLMEYADNLKVIITASTPLPANLAIAINGKTIDVDECKASDRYSFSSIKLNLDRTQAIVNYSPDFNPKDKKIYFPKGYGDPESSLIDVIIYSREKCEDTPIQIHEISNNGIFWEPKYANGEQCGVTNYSGESRIDLQ